MDEVHARLLPVGNIGYQRLDGATRSRVLDDARSTGDRSFCEDAGSLYGRGSHANEVAVRLNVAHTI